MRTARLMLDGIEVVANRRPVDPSAVARLKASIAEIGLQTPITVLSRADGPDTRTILVAGAHRLEALRQLGEDAADCFVIDEDEDAAELWEIDENFARAELSDAERAENHVRREAILIRRGDVKDAPHGGRPKNLDKLSKYSARAAADLGVDERTVRRDLARGKKIAPEVLGAVKGTALDKGVVLDKLAATPREKQAAKLIDLRREREEADQARKTTAAVDKAIAQDHAADAAALIHRNLDLASVDALVALLATATMKDFIAALKRRAA